MTSFFWKYYLTLNDIVGTDDDVPQYATIEGTAVELKIRSIPEREIVIGNQNNFKRLNITEEFKRVRLEKKGYEAATKLKTIGNTACSVYVSTY